jgi:alpha-N-arabinofuranosidase
MQAFVNVDVTEKQHAINPHLYGQFIEFLGRCIDRGLYHPGSPLSDQANGFRQDVLDKVKGLKPPILRYPGGTMVKLYHWMDGIGEVAGRKRQSNRIWGGVIDHAFGTNEFIKYCRLIGAEPFLVVNMTTGTAEEAANWVEYCNGTDDTYYANLRRSHGFAEPHKVKYWGLGNEEAAVPDIGFLHDPQEYIKASWEFAKLMKLADRSIKLVLAGDKPEWNKAILDELHPICDYLSLHYYASSQSEDYVDLFHHSGQMESLIVETHKLLKQYPAKVETFDRWYRFPPRQREIQIALDEWGIWQHNSSGDYVADMEAIYTWKEALLVASMLNVMQRQSHTVTMATFAQLVNILAPIFTNDNGSFCQTIYHPLQVYREHCGNWQLSCEVESAMLADGSGRETGSASLDVSATYNDAKAEVVVAVVNRHPEQSVTAAVSFGGQVMGEISEVIELNCPSWDTVNSFSADQVSRVTTTDVRYDSGRGYVFPPHSITLLKHRCRIEG